MRAIFVLRAKVGAKNLLCRSSRRIGHDSVCVYPRVWQDGLTLERGVRPLSPDVKEKRKALIACDGFGARMLY